MTCLIQVTNGNSSRYSPESCQTSLLFSDISASALLPVPRNPRGLTLLVAAGGRRVYLHLPCTSSWPGQIPSIQYLVLSYGHGLVFDGCRELVQVESSHTCQHWLATSVPAKKNASSPFHAVTDRHDTTVTPAHSLLRIGSKTNKPQQVSHCSPISKKRRSTIRWGASDIA